MLLGNGGVVVRERKDLVHGSIRIRRLAALSVVVAMTAACAGAETGSPTTSVSEDGVTTAAEGAPETTGVPETTAGETTAGGEAVPLGMMIGITGQYAPYTEASLPAADIAIQEINDAGGVLGRPVELITVDNKSTVEGAVQALSQLIDVHNVVAIGGPESDGILASLDTLGENQVPTMCPLCGTSDLDTYTGGYVFRIGASDSDMGLISAQFARDTGFTRMAMLVQNTEGTASPADVFKRTFTEQVGGEILADVRFEPGLASYQSQVEEAFRDEPDAVYLGAGFAEGGIILQEWQRRGYGGQWLFSPDSNVPEIANLVNQGVEIGDGIARSVASAYDIESPAYASYAPRYEEAWGEPPNTGLGDANHYDQFIILGLAIAKAGSTDGEAIAAAIPEVTSPPGTTVYGYAEGLELIEAGEDIDFYGATTNVDLNEFGSLARPLFAELQIVDGQWETTDLVELDESLRAG
jgi:branched-chain amino acid transport system substrate-binding protein